MDNAGHEAPGADENEEADNDADDRVGDVPAEGDDEDGGDHDADGTEEVGHDVLEGTLGVEAVLGRAVEDEGGGDVDGEASEADPEDGPAIDMGAFGAEAVVGLETDPGDDDPESDGVEKSGEDLGAIEAEGALGGGGALGDPHGEQGEPD